MPNDNNALAELAECLEYHDCHDDDFYPAVDKARRIVAELAKLRFDANMYDAYHTVVYCRAIAEEGVKNGK